MTEFKADEKVQLKDCFEDGVPVTVVSGPHQGSGGEVYLIKYVSGNHRLIFWDHLRPAPPEDPRREVIRKAWADADGVGYENLESFDYQHEVTAVLKALDAMELTKPMRYRDFEDDVWEQQPDGRLKLAEAHSSCTDPDQVGKLVRSYDWVSDRYGPLVGLV